MFDGVQHQTGLTNAAAELMRQINKELGNKKSRAITNIRHVHGSVLRGIVRSKNFAQWLKILTYIQMNLEPIPESFGNILKNRQI